MSVLHGLNVKISDQDLKKMGPMIKMYRKRTIDLDMKKKDKWWRIYVGTNCWRHFQHRLQMKSRCEDYKIVGRDLLQWEGRETLQFEDNISVSYISKTGLWKYALQSVVKLGLFKLLSFMKHHVLRTARVFILLLCERRWRYFCFSQIYACCFEFYREYCGLLNWIFFLLFLTL